MCTSDSVFTYFISCFYSRKEEESLLSAIFVVEKGVCLEPYEVNSEARESLKSTKELMWGKSSAYC